MPSKSPAQHRLMEAAAHTPGGFGGVPQSVGQEFAAADQAKKPKAKTKPKRPSLRDTLEKHFDAAQGAVERGPDWGKGERR